MDHSYRFRSVWHVTAARAEAYRALKELADYPAWWPQVRSTDRVDEETFRIRVRSLLPYDLLVTSSQVRADETAGVLEARLAGDLTGSSRWLITDTGAGARLVFEEDVVANKALLRRLGVVARPAFRANHTMMMRSGQRGLQAYVAGYHRGRLS